MDEKRYLIKFYYIGTEKFYGSQRQKNLQTVENCLIQALKRRKYIETVKSSGIEFASRTDRYVSARGAAFSFISNKKPNLMEINSCLPKEIGLWAYSEVSKDFRSRFNAIRRHYRYITLKPEDIDLGMVHKACEELKGNHDFINFSKREKIEVKTSRDLDYVGFKLSHFDEVLVFDFKSKGFLRQQIRRMVKKILELGMHQIEFEDFMRLFDRSNIISYQPADPTGLILWDIKFEDNIQYKIDKKSKERMESYFIEQEFNLGLRHKLFKVLLEEE